MANRIQIEISADARGAKEAFVGLTGASRDAFREMREGSLAFEGGLKGLRREFSLLPPEFSAGFREIEGASIEAATRVEEETRRLQEEHLAFLVHTQESTAASLGEQTALWSQFTDSLGGFVGGLETQFITAHEAMRQVGRSTFEGVNESLFQLINGTKSLGDVWQSVLDEMLKAVIRFVTSAAVERLLGIASTFLGFEMGGGGQGLRLPGIGGPSGDLSGLLPLSIPFISAELGESLGLDREASGALGLVGGALEKVPIIGDIFEGIGDIFGGIFQKGTPFVPRDMLAFLHRGEAVLPRELNPFAGLPSSQGALGEARGPLGVSLEGRLDRLVSLFERERRPLLIRFERGAFQGAHLRDERDAERLALEVEKRLRRRERLQLAPRVG